MSVARAVAQVTPGRLEVVNMDRPGAATMGAIGRWFVNRGMQWVTTRALRRAMRKLAEGQVDVTSLVSHVVPAADAADAYVLLDERPAEALQVVLEF